MRTIKRLFGGLLAAVALAFLLAWANAAYATPVLIPSPPLSPAEQAFKEWCASLPNWQYLLNPGCWVYFP